MLSISFVTYIKSVSRDSSSDVSNVPLIARVLRLIAFAPSGPSFNFMKNWKEICFKDFFAFSKGTLISLGVK